MSCFKFLSFMLIFHPSNIIITVVLLTHMHTRLLQTLDLSTSFEYSTCSPTRAYLYHNLINFCVKNLSNYKFFVLLVDYENLTRVQLFNVCERWTRMSCGDFATFKVTMFIMLYRKQPLENWDVQGSQPHNAQEIIAVSWHMSEVFSWHIPCWKYFV